MALTLAACIPGSNPEPPAPAAGSNWSGGLRDGPNGPIPAVVTDQFGYRPEASKVAVLRRPVTGYDSGSDYTPGATVELISDSDGQPAFSGSATPWRDGSTDEQSGDMAWWFDFSSVTSPGEYYVLDLESGLRSPTFTIGADVYRPVFEQALRTFLYQRAGKEKLADLVGPQWADGASHLGPGQDPETRAWTSKDDPATARDLRGGWYDAGDYNKYTAWHSDYLITLLRIYREHPKLIGDDLRIPESGNGISDLLDEINWGVSWLVRMQEPDASVLSVQSLASASPPSAATGPSYYGPPTTNATWKASAALAAAAVVFADSGEPELADIADSLAERAVSAWDWAVANPEVTYFNNDESRQQGSEGLASGQQETDDRGRSASRLEAAVHLYELTGDDAFSNEVKANYRDYLPAGSQSQWTVGEQEVLLSYAALPGVDEGVAQRIRDDYQRALSKSLPLLPAVRNASDPYRAYLPEYGWGSNRLKAAQGRMFAMADAYNYPDTVARPAWDAAEGYLHYLHGVNPLGLVYLSNMGEHGAESSATTMFHIWFAAGTPWDEVTNETPGPAPGFLVGGPNPGYQVNNCCSDSPRCAGSDQAALCDSDLNPPLNQPPMKSYLQFNDGWPVNSWEITENHNANQIQYLQLLADFVR